MTAQPGGGQRRYRASPRTTGEFRGRPRLSGWLTLVSLLTVWFYESTGRGLAFGNRGAANPLLHFVFCSLAVTCYRDQKRHTFVRDGGSSIHSLLLVVYRLVCMWERPSLARKDNLICRRAY
jgi:hypothetical protein